MAAISKSMKKMIAFIVVVAIILFVLVVASPF